MKRKTILLALENKAFMTALGQRLHDRGFNVTLMPSPGQRTAAMSKEHYDLLIVQDNHGQSDTTALLPASPSENRQTAVIVLTKDATVSRAVELLQRGAADYLPQDTDEQALFASVDRALASAPQLDPFAAKPVDHLRRMIAGSPKMQALLATAKKVADAAATVLIQGESGTGKELLARFIHASSGRVQQRFIALNCAALPENLAESELFGYEKGAFTGAVGTKTGKFEQAHKGTLLLDEISEMPLGLQAKLLRAIQEKQVERIGGIRSIDVDVRLVATTNRDLSEMVKKGQFREDLYYRLRVIPLKIPPLRERAEDIPLLVDHFLKKNLQPKTGPKPVFSERAMKALISWPWPGNVRELENAVERSVLISNGTTIGLEDLLLDEDMDMSASCDRSALVGMTVREVEHELISQTLSHVNQNRTHAAKMLGISIRTLRNKLRELGNLDATGTQ